MLHSYLHKSSGAKLRERTSLATRLKSVFAGPGEREFKRMPWLSYISYKSSMEGQRSKREGIALKGLPT